MDRIKSMIYTFARKLQKLLASETILVLGDSHAEVFNSSYFIKAFPFKYFQVVSVGGATASGLENPRSKTQAYKIFIDAVNKKNYHKIIVMLGEVDTGFVIWYRASKYDQPVDEMYKKTIDTYSKFIKQLSYHAPIIVISTPLPTIDDKSVGEVAHARKEVKASQKDRTELTLKFNQEIEIFCKKNKINHINLDELSLGSDGLVKPTLKNKDNKDHHYDISAYSRLIIPELKKVI